MKKQTIILMLTLVLIITFTRLSWSGVYLSREDALKKAFPTATQVETVNLFLTPQEKAQITALTGTEPDSSVYSLYKGMAGGEVLGYAAIESGNVRTMPETLLVVLGNDGKVKFVEILAFFEPEEYKPNQRWLDQFKSRGLSPELRIGGDIAGITGATLSAQAITRQVRKSAALCGLLLRRP